MACMCGDFCCSSCGPAQGNSRCPLCRQWVSEWCEHYNPRTGKLYGRFRAEARKRMEEEAAGEAEFERQQRKWEAEEEKYQRELRSL